MSSMWPCSSCMVVAALLLLLPRCDAAAATTPQYSQLWGKASELWDRGPRGRLQDYSFAGVIPVDCSQLALTPK
jgi:hypothetical protein